MKTSAMKTLAPSMLAPSRRDLLLGGGTLFAWAGLPKIARAEGRDPRLLTIVLRGAHDGLAAVAPVGDPNWQKLRGDKALLLEGKPAALPLDSFFALHPAMPNLRRLYGAGQALVVHAVSTPYRERSHFDGQDVLESGAARPGHRESGWLNRALGQLKSEGKVRPDGRAFAAGPVAPLIVRGQAPMLAWQPQNLPPPGSATTERLLDLYRHTDPALASALEGRIGLAAIANSSGMDAMAVRTAQPAQGIAATRAFFADAAGTAAKFMARPEGPRVGAISFNGWDTHINEGIASGALANLLGALDGAIAAAETNAGASWSQTIVAIITEFGRTARMNGAEGTDHGTGTTAILVGGALRGGRVIADWPGLRDADLYENRDLRATTDLRSIFKGLLRDHLRLDARQIGEHVFPGSDGVQTLAGLTRAS